MPKSQESWWCATAYLLGNYSVRTNFAVLHPGVHNFRHSADPSKVSTLDLLHIRDLDAVTHCYVLDYGPSDKSADSDSGSPRRSTTSASTSTVISRSPRTSTAV